MNLEGRRIAVYARFSSDRQSERSARDQAELCRRFVEAHGGRLDPALVYLDEGVSGAVRDRPGLLALREAVRARRLDVLVVEDLSRVGRDVGDVADLRRELAFYRVRLLGVSDGTDTEQRGADLGLDVRSVLAAHERREIGYRTRRGMEQRAREGLSTGGLGYGYRSEPVSNERDAARRIVVDPEGAAVIRRIFSWHADGRAPARIAEALNAEGVRSPRGRGWRAGAVRAILLNPCYIGRWTFGARTWERHPESRKRRSRPRDDGPAVTVERPELAIVDLETWERVSSRFVATRRSGFRPGRRVYLLSGIAVCGACGEPMSIRGGGTLRYYGCAASFTGRLCETGRRCLPEPALRATVLGLVRDRLLAPHALAALHELASEEIAGEAARADEDRAALDAQLRRHRERAGRLVSAIAEGLASPTVLGALRETEREIADLEARATATATPTRLPSAEDLVRRALDVSAMFDRDVDEGREVLRRFLDGGAVHVHRQGDRWTVRAGLLPLAFITGGQKNRGTREGRPCFDTGGCGGPLLPGSKGQDPPWILPVEATVGPWKVSRHG